MKLYAISDLHLRHEANRELLEGLGQFPEDWLIVAGDVGDSEAHLRHALTRLTERFAQVIWVPGNHELWTVPGNGDTLRGEAKYLRMVEVCRELGVITPEDPYLTWNGPPRPHAIVPLFLLYDYTFRPAHVPADRAIDWAVEEDLLCNDERFLHPDPHPSRIAWCQRRCVETAARIQRETNGLPTVLVGHWPLREDLAVLPYIPRFKIWCGTRQTNDWHLRFRATAVVFGHLHIRRTVHRDGVRFEEVSLGYPSQHRPGWGLATYLREILPGPSR